MAPLDDDTTWMVQALELTDRIQAGPGINDLTMPSYDKAFAAVGSGADAVIRAYLLY